ncbi:pyridoxal 5'-phosphate synthase glutaminase subunit PdxT [Brachybacterium huguangmaarense]|uniref:pyridoxal 5'-phosphate synthase glutaminase subunit PdxT n=1 Tax=Brachybacterium huguangmaarense TaxID=1652028 RepID=UPI0037BEEB34
MTTTGEQVRRGDAHDGHPDDLLPGAGLRVGVLALQGGVREHVELLTSLGARAVLVRRPVQLEDLDALVLPGGESSTIDRLTRILGLRDPLRATLAGGLPTLGTCAGLILLADRVLDPAPGQQSLGGLDVTVRRNAFGRQVDSAEETLATTLGPVRAAFIRAPEVVAVGEGVEVNARRGDDVGDPHAPIVGVRAGSLLGISFHPELTGETTVHRELLRLASVRRGRVG